jgi:hypothetical protein
MVRNYKRKTDRANYDKDVLDQAISQVKGGTMTLYKAYKTFKIPKTTLSFERKKGH